MRVRLQPLCVRVSPVISFIFYAYSLCVYLSVHFTECDDGREKYEMIGRVKTYYHIRGEGQFYIPDYSVAANC